MTSDPPNPPDPPAVDEAKASADRAAAIAAKKARYQAKYYQRVTKRKRQAQKEITQ